MTEEIAYCDECSGEKKTITRKLYSRNGPYTVMNLELECGHSMFVMSRPLQLQAYCLVCDHSDLGEGYLRRITEICLHTQSGRIDLELECKHKISVALPLGTKVSQPVQVMTQMEVVGEHDKR